MRWAIYYGLFLLIGVPIAYELLTYFAMKDTTVILLSGAFIGASSSLIASLLCDAVERE